MVKDIPPITSSLVLPTCPFADSSLASGKVVKFAKQNGAKIAKVGLKGLSTYYKLASHVAAFVPGVGKPLGRALKFASKAADIASDQIPVKLDGKWAKASSTMDLIKNPVGTCTAVDLACPFD